MLKGIKDMIKRKQLFQEEAQIIFEDAVDSGLDAFIILEADKNEDDDDNETVSKEGDEKDDIPEDDKDLEDLPLNDDESPEDEGEPEDDGSFIDTPLSGDNDEEEEPSGEIDPMNMSLGGDEDPLPEPMGAQTGEPVADNIDDILNMTIDLKTNTLTDVLPVPPPNAGDAVVGGADDDIMNTRIDSGFANEDPTGSPTSSMEDTPLDSTSFGTEEGEGSIEDMSLDSDGKEPTTETPDDPMDTPLGEASTPNKRDKKSSEDKDDEEDDPLDQLLSEGITLGGADPGTDPPAEAPPADSSTAPDANMDADGTENDVTAAVRDKVAEADIEEDTPLDDGIDLGGGGDALTGREELQDKLDKLNSSILDTKELVKKVVQS